MRIERGIPNACPPRSAHLTPLGILPSEFLKDKVYHTPASNLSQLKNTSALSIGTTNTLQNL